MAAGCNADAGMTHTFFKDYQSAIVGAVGFLGVMLTLWVNARLARISRETTITHQRNSVRAAIAGELGLLEYEAKLMLDEMEPNPIALLFQGFVPIEIYPSQMANIGALSMEEVRLVIRAYASIRAARANLSRDAVRGPNDTISLDRDFFVGARAYFKHAQQAAQEAIVLLERNPISPTHQHLGGR
jgi:hypothetical protein